IIAAGRMILGGNARAELTVALDQAPQHVNRLCGSAAAFKGKPDKVHSQQPNGRAVPSPVGLGSSAKGLGVNRFIANCHTILIDTFFVAPAPVGARAKRGKGDIRLWQCEILQLKYGVLGPGGSWSKHEGLAVEDRTVTILGEDDALRRRHIAQCYPAITHRL